MSQRKAGVENLSVREIARIIYDAVFLSGQDRFMPPFDEAEAEEIGGYERSMHAARLLLRRIYKRKD